MTRPSTIPISDKLKIVSKAYHVLWKYFTGETLHPNANLQPNPLEISVRSYITYIWLWIIKPIGNACAFQSYNFTKSYDSTYKSVFAPAYMLGYLDQVSLYSVPEHILETIPVKNHTAAYQHDPHAVVHFYILLLFYIRRKISR